MTRVTTNSLDEIARIIGNEPLASSIHKSITLALKRPCVRLSAKSPQKIFDDSLNSSIYDIENDPKGMLFRRLIRNGPHNPGVPPVFESDGKQILSDLELGECVEFIFSHMVNRFKGELAELLALEACSSLVMKLIKEKKLSRRTRLYWGEDIQEHRSFRARNSDNSRVKDFVKGADGLIVEPLASNRRNGRFSLGVIGLIEVKSMHLSQRKVLEQIDRHAARLGKDIRLAGRVWQIASIPRTGHEFIRVVVMPSTWKLNRKFHLKKTKNSRKMVFPEIHKPPNRTQIVQLEKNLWKVTLDWSAEALYQAGFEMTFWYMSQVGRHVFAQKSVPKGWEEMTPATAGYNSIKMMLYYTLLRPITKRQARLATRLYNVYCFGYPMGADHTEMLWPEMIERRQKSRE